MRREGAIVIDEVDDDYVRERDRGAGLGGGYS